MVKFAYAVGRIRALETHLLDESKIVRMTDSKDFESAYLVLRETPHYADRIDRLTHAFDFETLLENELWWTRDLLKELAPGNKMLSVIWEKYEPDLPLEKYLNLLNRTAKEENVPLFSKYARGFSILQRLKLDLLQGKIDADAAVTKFRYTDFNRAVSVGLEHFKKSGSLFVLEREIDNHLVETIKRAKYMAFGIEPLIGFAVAKEIEVKILRLILTAKQMHVKTSEIKERLRLPYV